MKNTMSFRIETDKMIYELETESVTNFVTQLSATLKEIGELEEDDLLEISSGLSSEEQKILQLAGY
jgi:uncharacterized Fe-S cluster-containing MiaB family protein